MLFRDPKRVPSISIHFIRVICGGGIGDEKQHIPADFSILPVNGYECCSLIFTTEEAEERRGLALWSGILR